MSEDLECDEKINGDGTDQWAHTLKLMKVKNGDSFKVTSYIPVLI
jgi:hypothetical protein